MCEAFNGPAPADKPLCMHLDENASNNKPENLAWGSCSDNFNFPGLLKKRRDALATYEEKHGPLYLKTKRMINYLGDGNNERR